MSVDFVKCPKCGNNDDDDDDGEGLDWGDLEMDMDWWQTITCNRCGFSWNRVFVFLRCEDVSSGLELDENGDEIEEAHND